MKNTIKKKLDDEDVEIFEVVSINDELLDGTIVEPRGKEALSERVFELLWEDIAYKLSLDYAKSLRESFIDVADDTLHKVNKLIDDVVSIKTLINYIKDEDKVNLHLDELSENFDKDMRTAQDRVNREFNDILKPAAELYSSYKGEVTNSFAEAVELTFTDWNVDEWTDVFDIVNDDDALMKKLCPTLVKKGYIKDGDFIDDDDMSFWKLLGAITSGIGDLLTLNGRLKKLCKSIRNEFVDSLPSEDKLREEAHKRIIDYINV